MVARVTEYCVAVMKFQGRVSKNIAERSFFYDHGRISTKRGGIRPVAGLRLARVPRVPGTRRNSEHHLWHPQILRFLIITGTRRAHSM